ncbi:Por secretion system C-terminal sorting domain-containing protein [Dyadobacter sp. SG02]|uniref:T9SS type A sorting domain-containing protein n=1 Tax=Dyadobacter sp. SG02 TaxID=1855291 RepID=UPI0008BFC6D7|nr:T9SS type A sorting domain-containing protein [Dyadobacter sp. SG02]SEJ59660.1 Por secretion system C-terminal sorting domain-containing protein [Dyadobacter sp. SG02]
MKKRLIALALPLWVMQAHGQTFTTYGPPDPVSINAGYLSDYSPNGTVVQAGGSVTLANASTYEHGNLSFQNNGTWLGQTNSLDLFNAAGALTISGSSAPGFHSLQFQNGGTVAITNTAGANVAGTLSFGTSGIISTTRNTHTISSLRLADGAGYAGGNTDAQHVNGYVTKSGDDAFVFPVGSGTDLRTVSISAPAAAATISTAWFVGSPATVTDPSDGATHSLTALAAPIEAISPVGFWDWINPAGSDDNVAVTVSIPDVTGFALPADLRLVGWNGTQWVALGTTGASAAAENNALSGTIPAGTSITALAIGSVEPPLPVTLVSFTGKAVENTVALNWATTEEINASHFEVQRSSDARNFEPIGQVDAKGDSKVIVNYAFADQMPLAETNYYRLKQVDRDGTFAFSKTISIRFEAAIGIKVYPNPVTDILRIESGAALQSVEIFRADGSKVTRIAAPVDHAAASLQNLREIDLRGQKPGIYIVIVNGKSFKVLKD